MALLLAAAVSTPAEEFDCRHIAITRTVESAIIAPDGNHIAYVLRVPRLPGREADGESWAELHVTDTAGTSRPFVTGAVNVKQPGWTPDGSAISFVAKLGKDKHAGLYVIPLDGGQARRVVSFGSDISGYAWSPDGQRVAFRATPPESEARKKLEKQGFKQEVYEEDKQATQVYVVAVPAGYLASTETPKPIELTGSCLDLRWSLDGARLLAKLAPTPLIDDEMMLSRCHVLDAGSAKPISQLETVGKLDDAIFSPDGRHVALIASQDINDPRAGRLVVADAATGKTRDVLPDYMGHVVSIAWQNDNTVMYVGQEGVWSTFGKVDLDGGGSKTIVQTGGAILQSVSLAKDGQSAAFVADSPAHPNEVFTMKHGDSAPRRLTDSNPWLSGLTLGQQTVEKHKARDGLELEGILIKPVGYEPGKKYPLVMLVHGGPESHVTNGWVTSYGRPSQALAAQGFAVFQPNYRGSTGRGVAFSKLGQHDAAGKEFDDLLDAVDYLVSTGLVDKDKVGVSGGSYGGYATAWCATKLSERFAAGVMFVGISDKYAAYTASDIPNENYQVHARVWPWEDPAFFRERSPLTYAGQCRTPLLILHGKSDPRVNPSQSLMMYRTLKLVGKAPVRLVWYPGEPHGNTKAAARYDFSLRLMQWMEHYLKGPGGDPPAYEIDYHLDVFKDMQPALESGGDDADKPD